jgi:4-amino-4-deoxychorismate lyase
MTERGLSFGDGLFETMLLRDGVAVSVDRHLLRLEIGCLRLGIKPPNIPLLRGEIDLLTRDHRNGIIKLIVTRGAGGRGYRPAADMTPTRLMMLFPPLNAVDGKPIEVRWCATRLARNAQLCGIKHLNRIEQVLAQNEWDDERIAEGLMLDTEGELICATAANVFLVADGVLVTPDLRFSGIRGVMRERVIESALRAGLAVEERAVWPDDLTEATEVFVTSAIRGIRSVVALQERRWSVGHITQMLIAAA